MQKRIEQTEPDRLLSFAFSFALCLQILVLGEGFEPSQSLSPPGLQPGAINHSTTPALHRTRLKPACLSRGSIQIIK